jgi:hypothetical protein
MPFQKLLHALAAYLSGLPPVSAPPVSATFITNATINVNVTSEPEPEATEPARKKRKTGLERYKAMLKCKDNNPKPVLHKKALRSNVNMKERTMAKILKDTNERVDVYRATTHPDDYYKQ